MNERVARYACLNDSDSNEWYLGSKIQQIRIPRHSERQEPQVLTYVKLHKIHSTRRLLGFNIHRVKFQIQTLGNRTYNYVMYNLIPRAKYGIRIIAGEQKKIHIERHSFVSLRWSESRFVLFIFAVNSQIRKTEDIRIFLISYSTPRSLPKSFLKSDRATVRIAKITHPHILSASVVSSIPFDIVNMQKYCLAAFHRTKMRWLLRKRGLPAFGSGLGKNVEHDKENNYKLLRHADQKCPFALWSCWPKYSNPPRTHRSIGRTVPSDAPFH